MQAESKSSKTLQLVQAAQQGDSKMNAVNFAEAYYSNFFLHSAQANRCSHYKRLNWSVSYFLQQWDSQVGTICAGTIVRYGKLFHVSFMSGVSLNALREIAAIHPNWQISLSFRKCGNMPAIVIVSNRKM